MVWQVGTAVLYLDLERREGQREGPGQNCYWDPVVQGKEERKTSKKTLGWCEQVHFNKIASEQRSLRKKGKAYSAAS